MRASVADRVWPRVERSQGHLGSVSFWAVAMPEKFTDRPRSPPGPGDDADLTRAAPFHTLGTMKVLVTGGAGYIGSITAKALEEAGHVPVILDSLLTGPQVFVRDRIFYEGDIADRALVARVVEEHPDIEATIHMAARIVVPESVALPYEYYRDNVAKSLELFDQLEQLGKQRVLFSSSASLYAVKPDFEVTEDDPLAPGSPYARTKRMMEQVLADL